METDYLIIGAGGMGMAFADSIVTETDASIIIVDKHDRPGGHWNDAYPFVRLHQPSSFYGVNSRRLGNDAKDQQGWNKGLYELASASEVCTYFEQVMSQDFLPTGRVKYFPMCSYEGDGRIKSLVSDATYQVTAINRRVVDATYLNVTVPSVRGPDYEVDPGVSCIPLNDLPKVAAPYERYVVIGAGKTGVDACLWLLRNEVPADRIVWIMPRDSWLVDRANIQFGDEFYEKSIRGRAMFFEAAAEAETLEDLFHRLEDCGQLLRLDKDVWPTMYRCSTVTRAEMAQLRRIENVVRLGRVTHLTAGEVVLADGTAPTPGPTLHIDCTADGLPNQPPRPVFEPNRITLQTVRPCQQTFSSSLIGHVEAAYDDDEVKNELCQVAPNPDNHVDWLRATLGTMTAQRRWAANKEMAQWLSTCRLDIFSRAAAEPGEISADTAELLKRAGGKGAAALARLKALIDEAEATAND